MEDITESVYASGIIKSENQYEVFSTVNGIARRWLAREGDIVNDGQAILEVSGEAARLQAESALIAAQNAARKTNSERIAELQTNIDEAKLRMDQCEVDLRRQRNLWAQQIGSRNQLEQRNSPGRAPAILMKPLLYVTRSCKGT
ncbi:efflux RND transporter periplasmic adaptor subunit [Chitinophaga sedimenti]|uniref:efflux RND transporter periplasmic adaptor subunit n=1 Tax=Chitinophaga sedimenti TaxID=2033606 RepID=UPI002006A26C|nr:efflux RND transporter periplasmic adaptor subunit [Chitinophaga sedimenti]MCK7557133.1 efflux RND transporter periplasmic adaptor subunit [Chitinophaga sedimenti]